MLTSPPRGGRAGIPESPPSSFCGGRFVPQIYKAEALLLFQANSNSQLSDFTAVARSAVCTQLREYQTHRISELYPTKTTCLMRGCEEGGGGHCAAARGEGRGGL